MDLVGGAGEAGKEEGHGGDEGEVEKGGGEGG